MGELASGVSNAQGWVQLNHAAPEQTYLYALDVKGGVLISENYYYNSEIYNTKLYATTDHPLYRPGDTVNIKVVGREFINARDSKPLADAPIQVTVLDPNGLPVANQTLQFTGSAGGDTSIKLPATSTAGGYDIQMTYLGEVYSAAFRVADFQRPVSYTHLAANSLRWFGEAIDKVYDEIAPTADNTLAMITREPIGVVGAIVPWNYPILMACWKIAPALASGNSVVLKPSEKSPLTALRLGDLALEAGIPAGVLNIIPGFGEQTGTPLAMHMDVDCIAFTGSTGVGKKIQIMAGQSNLKRAWCELGGKSPNIVFADCKDLDKAAAASAGSVFYNQGESCNAPSRLLVELSLIHI